jgi:hypothetical protein
MICTPAYRGIQCIPYLDSLSATVKLLMEHGIECDYRMLPGCCYVQTARNTLAKRFLDSDCDALLFLDDDVSWDPQDVLRLLQAKQPIIAGIYPLKQPTPHYPVVLLCDDNGYALTDGPYLRASRVPTGFLLVTRAVLEAVQAAYPHLEYIDIHNDGSEDPEEEEFFDFFPQGVYDRRWMGEDFAFCRLWSGIGGEIAVVPDMTLHHHGLDDQGQQRTWTGNLAEFLRSRPGGDCHGEA